MSSRPKPSSGDPILRMYKPAALLIAGVLVCLLLSPKIYAIRGKYAAETVSEFGQLPPSALQALSFEFKGIVSDYLFFKTMTYMGLKLIQQNTPSKDEWQLINHMLQKTTDLDPRFWDPYVFAEMMLAWQAGMSDEANTLLEKAALHRPDDYRPDYFIGFNYLYFNKDAAKAAPPLRKAAQCANAPGFVKGLASRFSLYAGQTGTGILFLENLIKETADPKTVQYLGKRLLALKMIYFLEAKVKEYKLKYGRIPETLDDLVTTGVVQQIPTDPYGGKFVLLQNGRVYTTSEMLDRKPERK